MQKTQEKNPIINLRKIAEWNREIVARATKAGIEVSGKPIDIKKVLTYSLDEDLRNADKFTNESAMKAEMFLEWLYKNHPQQN